MSGTKSERLLSRVLFHIACVSAVVTLMNLLRVKALIVRILALVMFFACGKPIPEAHKPIPKAPGRINGVPPARIKRPEAMPVKNPRPPDPIQQNRP